MLLRAFVSQSGQIRISSAQFSWEDAGKGGENKYGIEISGNIFILGRWWKV